MWNLKENKTAVDIDPEIETLNKKMNEAIENTLPDIIDIINNAEDVSGAPEKFNVEKSIIENGIKMMIGNRKLTLSVSSDDVIETEEIENAVKVKYQNRLIEIKTAIEDKFDNVRELFDNLKFKLNDEIEKAKAKNNDDFIIPKINKGHAEKGLSVVRGDGPEDIIWLYRTLYKPITLSGKPLSQKIIYKIATPVIIEIRTYRDTVKNVQVLKNFNLTKFSHYHAITGNTDDCWGNWEPSTLKWETPDDIIDIADYAINMLSDINDDSIGTSAPDFLPTFEEVRDSIRSPNSDEMGEEEQIKDDLEKRMNKEHVLNNVWTTNTF